MKHILSILIFFIYSIINAQIPTYNWLNNAGGTSNDFGYRNAIDTAGNIYVSGPFASTVMTVGTQTLVNLGDEDVYVIKYDVSGGVIWAKSISGSDKEGITSIALDRMGNLYVTGGFRSPTLVIGTYTLTNLSNSAYVGYLVKFDGVGNIIWAKQTIGGNGGVTVDTYGNVYVIGSTDLSFTFGASVISNTATNLDIYVLKYDVTGNPLWAIKAGGTGDEEPTDIACDGNGNVYITGFVIGNYTSFTFGPYVLYGTSHTDFFVVKINPSGNVMWANHESGVNDKGWATKVDVDKSGNIYVAGVYNNPSISFGSITLPSINNTGTLNHDMFIVKYNNLGNVLWAKSVIGADEDYASSVIADRDGSAILVGYSSSPSLTCGTQTFTNTVTFQSIMVKFDELGNVAWATTINDAQIIDISDDKYDFQSLVITGLFNSPTLHCDNLSVSNIGAFDIFNAKLKNTGVGIQRLSEEAELLIYPIPSEGIIYIKTDLEIVNIEVFNILGEKVKDGFHDFKKNHWIDLSGFPVGIYTISLRTGLETLTKKVIIE